MKTTRPLTIFLNCLALLAGWLELTAADSSRGKPAATRTPSPFAKNNLHAWAYEEYDSIKRTPEERAQVLKDLGITKAGYICRNAARVAEFEAYVKAYQKAGIELISVWTPVNTEKPLEEIQIRTFLEVADRHKLKLQWWLTLEEDFEQVPAAQRMDRAIGQLRPLVAEANQRGMKLVIYGHGAEKWFTQAENEIAMAERLKKELPSADIGIVYSFHQAFSQMDRFKDVFPRLQPYLAAVNLNGNSPGGMPGITIGKGNREQGMIKVIKDSGWHGPVGVLSHNRATDAKANLQANLDGLREILKQIGDHVGASTY